MRFHPCQTNLTQVFYPIGQAREATRIAKYEKTYFLLSFSTLALASILLAMLIFPRAASSEESSIETTIDQKLDEVFESKQTRYRREQREADDNQQVQEQLRKQEEELRRNEAEIRKRKQQGFSGGQPHGQQNGSKVGRAPVEFFTIRDCNDCKRMEEFLKEAGVSYTRYDVERDPFAEKKYLNTVGKGDLPVTRVRGEIVRGYRPQQVRAIIEGSRTNKQLGAIPPDAKGLPPPQVTLP